jgi:predicted metal-dependent hydrolase
MLARRPQFDFSHAAARWTPAAPAYARQLDAASLMLPYLEPYLIKVEKLARERLDPDRDAALIRDIDLFNQQEANHFRLHAQYNEALRASYPGLEPFEDEIRADFASFLRERSLGWNLAYCEGFECSGIVGAEFFFGPGAAFLVGADPAPRELWAWHLAEEFEHRTVCHDALRALHPGYRRRIGGYFAFLRHLQSFCDRVAAHLLAVDRERGSLPAGAVDLDRRFRRAQLRFSLPRILKILSPAYDPAPRRASAALDAALLRYE